MQATFNQVSHCCHKEIIVSSRIEYPLGGSTWGQTFKVDVCEGCGLEAEPVDQCGICGVVGCQGECEGHVRDYFEGIVDISEVEE